MKTIEEVIADKVKEMDNNEVLTAEKAAELTSILTDFIEQAIPKYIRGQEDHGGNIHDRDMDIEIDQELVDLVIYQGTRKRWHSRMEQSE